MVNQQNGSNWGGRIPSEGYPLKNTRAITNKRGETKNNVKVKSNGKISTIEMSNFTTNSLTAERLENKIVYYFDSEDKDESKDFSLTLNPSKVELTSLKFTLQDSNDAKKSLGM